MTDFRFSGERFADIQMLRYRLNSFEDLTLNQKLYIYYLAEATLWGRDITFDQFGKYNLRIRRILERCFTYLKDTPNDNDADEKDRNALVEYLKRVWFSNGIYHHYGCEKFVPDFSEDYFRKISAASGCVKSAENGNGIVLEDEFNEICKVIFDPEVLPKRVNKAEGEDLIKTSACNYYKGLTQQEVEEYYASQKDDNAPEPPSYGLNSTLVKHDDGSLSEDVWHIGGKYGKTIERIVENLRKASDYAENDKQREIISILVDYYTTGDLRTFDRYSIEWLKETEGMIDFINGFIEVYGDPLGIKASWEGIVEYKDIEACERTQKICRNAQWFEDHSPVASQFKKPVVKGVTANVICAAMLGGDEYPSTAIGINLPNADWIRAQYGSKSVTISNLTQAYDEAAKGNGFLDEFAIDEETVKMVRTYGDKCDDLHTDLHECLGHGSGQLLPGTDPNALKNYSSTIEEARADLFGLYFIADQKLIELGLLDSPEAYKAQYYTYLMNGLMTQSVRIKLGSNIEEAHMRNRALIANWCMEHSDGAVIYINKEGKTYVQINDYERLRSLFAELLAEIQRIKSEGDYEAARSLVEQYGVKLDQKLHAEVLERYKALNIAPYKGFLNPRLSIVADVDGTPTDVVATYDETLEEQMMRYSSEYSISEVNTVQEQLKQIKRSFRLYMNGVTAQSMREKGVNYHINWGVSLMHLQEMAKEYGKNYELAILLYKENIRECKLLATMIMPANEFDADLAWLWIEQIPTQEIAEFLVLNLLQDVPYASDLAFQLLAERDILPRICGYNLMTRLFAKRMYPTDRDINEFLDQAQSALAEDPLPLRNSVTKAIQRFAELGEEYELIVNKLQKRI